MTPDDSRLAVLPQQGAEAANLVVAEKSAGISRKEPSGGHNDQTRRARSEVAILYIISIYWFVSLDLCFDLASCDDHILASAVL
jgi:hypothetical protein